MRLTKDGRVIYDAPFADEPYQGRPRRTKYSHPYSYDPFVYWKKPGANACTGGAYTDRMWGWWGDKLREASKRIWGTQDNEYGNKLWDCDADPDMKKFSKILSEVMNKQITVVRIDEYCNWSNGYPTWNVLWLEKGGKRHKMCAPGEGGF